MHGDFHVLSPLLFLPWMIPNPMAAVFKIPIWSIICVITFKNEVPCSTAPLMKSDERVVFDKDWKALSRPANFNYIQRKSQPFVSYNNNVLYFHIRLDHFLTTLIKQQPYLFDLRGFHPRHLRLRPTIVDLDIQDFHLYSLV